MQSGHESWLDLLRRYRDAWRYARQDEATRPPLRLDAAAYDFLPPVMSVREQPPSPYSRFIIWGIFAMLLAFFGWSLLGELELVASAPGKVVSAKRTQSISVPEVGTIRRILVADGQAVRQGDVLLEMDTGVVDSLAGQARDTLSAALAEVARHQALLASYQVGRVQAPVFDVRVSSDLADIERRVVQTAWMDYAARLAQLEAEVALKRAQVDTVLASLEKSQALKGLSADRVVDYQRLKAEGFLSDHAVKDQERERLGHELDAQRMVSQVQEAKTAVAEALARRQVLVSEAQRTAAMALSEAQHRASVGEQELARTQAMVRRLEVRAPVDGVVQQLQVFTQGGAVKEAQVLMSIAQADEGLELEVMISNADIGFVREGQTATLKFDAFPYTKYGTLQGEVRVLARDAVVDEKRGLLFPARIRILTKTSEPRAQQIVVQQGLLATADIKTGERRVIEYFLSPVLRYQSEALRER